MSQHFKKLMTEKAARHPDGRPLCAICGEPRYPWTENSSINTSNPLCGECQDRPMIGHDKMFIVIRNGEVENCVAEIIARWPLFAEDIIDVTPHGFRLKRYSGGHPHDIIDARPGFAVAAGNTSLTLWRFVD